MSLIRHLYSLLLYLLLPLVLWQRKRRARSNPGYGQRTEERFAHIPRRNDRPLWIHAVSVGETVAIAPLVEQLRARQPQLPLLITTMTPTGSARVQALFADKMVDNVPGGAVSHCYIPYDLPHLMNRFLDRVQPRGLLVVETELWPNTIAACHKRQLPVLLANARLSERSAQGYSRVSLLTRPMLQQLSRLVAQDHASAERFVRLGLPPEKLTVSGSIKFDQPVPADAEAQGQALRAQWGAQRPVLVAGSCRELDGETEEQQLLKVYQSLQQHWPDLLLVLVPRHPERFDQAFQLAQTAGWRCARRSNGDIPADSQVVIGDTMGELTRFYAAADLCFVGGSLVETGGHNPLEPALLGKPVFMGPHLFNFSDISSQLRVAGGLTIVDNAEQLTDALHHALQHPEQSRQQGAAAQRFIEGNRGALEKLYSEVEKTFGLY